MINPLKVAVCIPALDARMEVVCAGGLIAAASAHYFNPLQFLCQDSDIRHARNALVHWFKSFDFDWLVFIDSDIGFSAKDFRLLMNYPASIHGGDDWNPEGVTLITEPNTRDEHAAIVCAEYPKKNESKYEAVRFGMGFTRIHKSVFEKLDQLSDSEGEELVRQYPVGGGMVSDYFPSGVIDAGHWRSEDTGFFMLCRLAGIVPRIEQGTTLQHVGRKVFYYEPPQTDTGKSAYHQGGHTRGSRD